MKAQYAEVRKALYGEGQFVLTRSLRRFVLRSSVWHTLSDEEKADHETSFHWRKVVEKKSSDTTITSTDSKLTVPAVTGIAKKPGQRRQSKSERTCDMRTRSAGKKPK